MGTGFTLLLFCPFLWEQGVQPEIRGPMSHQKLRGQQQHLSPVSVYLEWPSHLLLTKQRLSSCGGRGVWGRGAAESRRIRNELKTTRQRQKDGARVHGMVCRGTVLAVLVTPVMPNLPSWRQLDPIPMLWGSPPSSALAPAFPRIIHCALSTLGGTQPWSDVGASAGGACRS